MANKDFIKKANWTLGVFMLIGIITVMLICYKTFIARSLFFLLVCCLICLVRIFLGPTSADRAVALMIINMLIVGYCGLLSIFMQREWYIDIAFIWILQSFIVTLSLAKFLEGKRFEE